MAKSEKENLSGLTDAQAKETMKFVLLGFFSFTAIATVAHYLTWLWRPWIPKEDGTYSMIEAGQTVIQSLIG
ncbi:MAG: light-harvesting antenna LH1, beta subunit [Myxococcota bacterium]